MDKKLIHWALPGSPEDKYIREVADKYGKDPEKVAHIIDDSFRFFREAMKDPRLPEINFGRVFRLVPCKDRIFFYVHKYIAQAKVGLRPVNYVLYLIDNLRKVHSRLAGHKSRTHYEQYREVVRWENISEELEESRLKHLRKHKATGDRSYSSSLAKRNKFLELMRLYKRRGNPQFSKL